MKQFQGAKPTSDPNSPAGKAASGPIPAFNDRPATLEEGAVWNPIPHNIAPIWPDEPPLDISIYVHPSVSAVPLKSVSADALVVKEKKFRIGDYGDSRDILTTI